MIFPNKTTTGFAPSVPFVFFPTTTLTNAYVAGTVASFDEHNMIGLEITYIKGSETTMNIKVESSVDGGVTYGQQVTQSASGGTTTITPNIYAFTAASMAATQIISLLINPIKGDHIRVSVEYAGGSGPGTVAIRGMFGWV